MKVGFISLGCSKNLIDTEITIGLFQKHGYQIINKAEEADILVVNTCGFIESAKEEAINTILEMAEYKKKNCQKLIVMGCLVERYQQELSKAIPEVDLFIRIKEYDSLWEQIENCIKGQKQQIEIKPKTVSALPQNVYTMEPMPMFPEEEYKGRVITTGANYAYLKIGEGCSNRCTYCAIPGIRGPFVSRKMEDILEEAQNISNTGISEIIVIAQDTTKYGIDLYGKPMLAELLEKLSKIETIKWIRFLYSYPETITEELIQVVKQNKKICSYFDIPIQHISNRVLKRMNRQSDGESIRKTIQHIRKEIPDVILRTTVMVGFPGETEEDFKELYQFLQEAKFDKLGAFTYSKEENTPASRMKEQIHPMTKKSRYRKLMELQQKIAEEKVQEKIGRNVEVLVEGMTQDKKYVIGRTYMDVPEIDGVIYVENPTKEDEQRKWITCQITQAKGYDMIGKKVE